MKITECEKKKCLDGGELVFQHNNLVEARYRLTLQEKRLVLWLASQVTTDDKDFKEHILKIKDFSDLFGVTNDGMYSDIKNVTRRLMQRILSIRPIGENRLIQIAWLGCADYKFNEGTVSLSFHPHLRPFLLELKNQFTTISLADTLCFKSIHSIRIFEILKQYESLGERRITIQKLKDCCGITQEKYKRMNDFKRYVLDVAMNEINEKTDIKIDFEFVKKSRKFESVHFTIRKNKKYISTQEEKQFIRQAHVIEFEMRSRKSFCQQIENLGFAPSTAKKMISGYSDEHVKNAIKSVFNQIARGHVLNPKAMMRTALKEGWKPDVFIKKEKTSD